MTNTLIFIKKLENYNIDKIFTLKPVDEKDFNFILPKECIKTTQINIILHKHDHLIVLKNNEFHL